MTVLKRLFLTGGLIVVVVASYFFGKGIVKGGNEYVPEKAMRIEGTDLGTAGKKDINSATKYDIKKLKDFGEAYAENIVQYREELGGFKGMDDLIGARRIGEKRVEKLKKYFSIKKEN